MKNFYLAIVVLIVVVSLVSLSAAQNADPTLKPHHTTAIPPVFKGTPVHHTAEATPHKAANIAAPNAGAKANGTDAQLHAIEHQQATVHNPKPAPKTQPAKIAGANRGGNQPMNFAYKAPPPNNVMVGGSANGRAKQR
jgi:hypothetical protein